MSRVLLVEDDPANRESLAFLLQIGGHGVDTACHGADALEQLSHGPSPGLILLDLSMPVMDGWEFLRRKRECSSLSAIPVVVLSALADWKREELLSVGVVSVLQKPADLEELLVEVGRYCRVAG